MTVRDIGDVIIYAGTVAAALAAIGALLRYIVLRPLKTWITEQIKQPVDAVHAEMSPDHGHSLRDAVNRTEGKVDSLTLRFEDHLINHPKGR